MKFYVIGDEQTVMGFSLVGVEGRQVSNEAEATEALGSALARQDIGVLLVTDEIARMIRESVDAKLYGTGFPLVLEIPSYHGALPDRPTIEEIVRKAIGLRL